MFKIILGCKNGKIVYSSVGRETGQGSEGGLSQSVINHSNVTDQTENISKLSDLGDKSVSF